MGGEASRRSSSTGRVAQFDRRGEIRRRADASPRSFLGRTAIGSALDFAMGLFRRRRDRGRRKVIDVSGDGTSNQGRGVTERATPHSSRR